MSAAPLVYDVAEDQSYLYATIQPDTSALLSGLGHAHVIVAKRLTGVIRYDPKELSTCSVQVTASTAALAVDEDSMRRRLGWKPLAGWMRERVDSSMRARDQLATAEFPVIEFSGADCAQAADAIVVRGLLSVRGAKRHVEIPMRVAAFEERLKAAGAFEVLHTDFGFRPYVAFGGGFANSNRIEIHVRVLGRLRGTPMAAK